MMEQFQPTLLPGLESEQGAVRRRETFLLSVILHLLMILFVVTQPDFFEKLRPDAELLEPRPEDVTLLYQPPERPQLEPPPKVPVLPEAEREAPVERAIPVPRLPYLPPVPRPTPEQPGLGDREENLLAQQLPPIGLPEFPGPGREPGSQKPVLEPVPEPKPSSSQARLQLPSVAAPGRGTDAILKDLARERAAGRGRSLESGVQEFDSENPNFSMPGPQILSDTMGVDFQPYLLRVYLVVRRNWYAVIPEIARLGKQGKVVLQFTILQNGEVPDLVLTAGSGTQSLDSAALASIRLSNPFPPLPAEFPGDQIRLRFTYLYNLPWNY